MKVENIIQLCQKFDAEYDSRASVREIAILAYLIENGGTAIGDLGFSLKIGQPVVSRFVKKMEQLGFIVRDGSVLIATEKAKGMFV